jgi:hypothetical protein
MRAIEKKMNKAIRSQENFRLDNTEVKVIRNGILHDGIYVFLHNNLIAEFGNNNEIWLASGGWQSNTTKSRLNAICSEFAPNVGIFQKNWEWFVSTADKILPWNGNTLSLFTDFNNGSMPDGTQINI